MNDVNYIALGKKIQYHRIKLGLTQEQLGNKVNLSQKQISNIERAYSIPTLQSFVNICNALDQSPNQLLMDSIVVEYPERYAEMITILKDCPVSKLMEINKYIHYILSQP